MKILYASSEVDPFAKTGGLADVAGTLPVELASMGHDVRVVMPYYRCVQNSAGPLEKLPSRITLPIAEREVTADIFQGELPGKTMVYFIGHDGYYDRDELYGTKDGDYQDNAERFLFFSKAILDLPKKTGFVPDIFHCNDWQTGLTPLLLAVGEKSLFAESRSVFTVHNLSYQGIFWHLDLPMTNLGWEVFTPGILEFYGKINLLKAGIVGADAITTVSKRYALEIQTSEYGCGLEGVLQARGADLSGILNGADYDTWSPQNDRWIAKRYSPSDLSGKKACRTDLLTEFKLNIPDAMPVLGVLSRLVDQKGMDLVGEALDAVLRKGTALVVLGSGEEKYHACLREVRERYPDRVGLCFGFNNALAHKIEAGADLFLMPSRFEPCGLNQMYSMKYGTIPLVRATGGLDDTVKNFDAVSGTGNGFKFQPYTAEALLEKIAEALGVFSNKAQWASLMHNAMQCDYSWRASAREYEKLYTDTLKKKRNICPL